MPRKQVKPQTPEEKPSTETAVSKTIKDQLRVFGGLAETTSRVVEQAVSILEEEMAAGVSAAKDIEQRFVNVEELRSGKPNRVTKRLRANSHELIDILLDLAEVGMKFNAGVGKQITGMAEGKRQEVQGEDRSGQLPTLSPKAAVRPGAVAHITMKLANSSGKRTGRFTFLCTGLVSPTGRRIPEAGVSFSPRLLSLKPRETREVEIAVRVPKGTPAGTYSGLVQAQGLSWLRAVLSVEVA